MSIFARFVPGTFQNLEEFKQKALDLSKRVRKRKPLLLVFDELVLGSKPVSRKQTKKTLRKISKSLPQNCYVFFSVAEKTGKRELFYSNTGYVIQPTVKAKKAKYKVYPKLSFVFPRKKEEFGKIPSLGELDMDAIKKIAQSHKEKNAQVIHWLERQAKWIHKKEKAGKSVFPELKIGGKKVKFAVCGDASKLFKLRDADLIVVPAKSLHINPRMERVLPRVLKPGQKILISNAFRKKDKKPKALKIYRSQPKAKKKRKGIVSLKKRRIHRVK